METTLGRNGWVGVRKVLILLLMGDVCFHYSITGLSVVYARGYQAREQCGEGWKGGICFAERTTVMCYVYLSTYSLIAFDTVFSVVNPFHPEARGKKSADYTED